jgi:glycosyltransferase involved in cell wall biosynthesis
MAHCRTPVQLIIGGKTGNASYESHLKSLISKHQLENRVSFKNEWITEAEKTTILSHCLAAAYLPLDEDSYGYPTLEAAHSLKALISTTDSGGVLEFVKDKHNGFICEPNPKSLAAAIDLLHANKPLAKEMGENAGAQIKEVRIDWQNVCTSLLA